VSIDTNRVRCDGFAFECHTRLARCNNDFTIDAGPISQASGLYQGSFYRVPPRTGKTRIKAAKVF